jgi:hypothetical protein
MGVNVIGDLNDLTPLPRSPQSRAPEDVGAYETLDIALDVIPSMLGKLRDEADRADQAEHRAKEAEEKAKRLQFQFNGLQKE